MKQSLSLQSLEVAVGCVERGFDVERVGSSSVEENRSFVEEDETLDKKVTNSYWTYENI